MQEFNGNEHHQLRDDYWNIESRIYGLFGELYLDAKFYKFDGSKMGIGSGDYRAKRGVLVRDHYDSLVVPEVHLIVDNLEEFLNQQNIKYIRTNRLRR